MTERVSIRDSSDKACQGRTAFFLPSLRGGGAERSILHLVNGLAERGLLIDLVVVEAVGPYLDLLSSAVRLIDLHAGRTLRAIPGLMRYLRKTQPTCLLSVMDHVNIIALIARRLSRIPCRIIISTHTVMSVAASHSLNKRERLIPYLSRLVYPWADSIVAVSKVVADDLVHCLGLPRERIHVIYNPVAISELMSQSKIPIDHPWLTSGKAPVILGVGRLTPVKDFPTLIRAFNEVRSERDARLVILGEGEQREDLEALIQLLDMEEDVNLPGFVENPFSYMAQAAVMVLSSRTEALPSVLIQAMACGTPVVSTDCPGGVREILEDGKYGELAPVGDAHRLAQAILSTLDNPAKPEWLQRKAAEFSLENSLNRYLSLIFS